MTTFITIGVLLISAGPLFAFWLVTLHRRSHLLVIAILSAFTWCIAMMLTSAIWLAIPPLKSIYPWVLFLAVTIQELARFALSFGFRALLNYGENVQAFLRPGVKNDFRTSVSVGAGFGFMSVAVNFYSLFSSEFSDDTSIYVENCDINFFVAGSGFALAFYVLHVLLAIIVWPSYFKEMGWILTAAGYSLHLVASEATLINRNQNGCQWGLIIVWILVTLTFSFTVYLTKLRFRAALTANA
ncbi:unnamed protein product [Agarophyton chilense]